METNIVVLVQRFLESVESLDEYKTMESYLRTKMNENIQLESKSTYAVTIEGRIIEQKRLLANLSNYKEICDYEEKIAEFAELLFVDAYGIDEWFDIVKVYKQEDFKVLSEIYQKMGENAFFEVKYKANPYEDENVQSYGDKTLTMFRFESIKDYLTYIAFEVIERTQLDIKEDVRQVAESLQGVQLDDEGFPIVDDLGPLGEYGGE